MIAFYRTNEEYGCFSNFSKHPVELDGRIWPRSEHYYQAMKFDDYDLQEKIRSIDNPGVIAEIGRDRSNPIRQDWDQIKDDVMRKVIYAKFTQNSECKEKLIQSGSEEIIEASPYDSYWGWGPNKNGKNMLGKILMEVRTILTEVKE